MNHPESPIYRLRAEYGLTQEQLANALGFSRNYVHLMEAGIKPVSRSVQDAIARFSNSKEEKRKQEAAFRASAYPREPHLREPPPIYGTPSATSEHSITERLDRMEAQLQTLTQLLGASLAASAQHVAPSVAGGEQQKRKAG